MVPVVFELAIGGCESPIISLDTEEMKIEGDGPIEDLSEFLKGSISLPHIIEEEADSGEVLLDNFEMREYKLSDLVKNEWFDLFEVSLNQWGVRNGLRVLRRY